VVRNEHFEPLHYTYENAMSEPFEGIGFSTGDYVWSEPKQLAAIFHRKLGWSQTRFWQSGIIAMPTWLECRLIGQQMRNMFSIESFPREFEGGEYVRGREDYIEPVKDDKWIIALQPQKL
jgi:hypothetical protein